MKAILILLCLLFCVEAYATLPVYSDVRAYVEKHNPNDQTPATNRIFMAFEWSDSVIVPYHDGMKLEDVIKQSKFKGRDVFIFVFRGEGHDRPGTQLDPVYDSRFTKVKRSEFVVRPLDAIHLVDILTSIN
jgi:hypothetical protein